MSNNLYDGAKIYDTPKFTGESIAGVLRGYNCGFEENSPTYSIGSSCNYVAYWERQLFREILSILDFDIPRVWDRDYTLWVLFRNGFFAYLKNAEIISQDRKTRYKADIPQGCTLAGRNVFYHPTRAIVANPAIKNQRWTIGENCAIIKLTPDYTGIWDLVHHYAEELGNISQSLNMAIVNSRLAYGYVADSKAGADTLRTMLECVDKGQPAVITKATSMEAGKDGEKRAPWVKIENSVGRDYVVDKLEEAEEARLNAFRRAIGIPVLSDKKERENVQEVNVTVGSAMTAIDVWYDSLKRSIEIAKEFDPAFAFDVRKVNLTEGGRENAI